MSDFFQFLNAVFWHWQSWLGGSGFGGAVVVFVALYERLSGHSMSKRMYVITFIIAFLFAAFFLAWRDQYQLRLKAENQLLRDRPNFSGRIEQIVSGYSPEIGAANVFVLITITNKGSPSIADGFTAILDNGALHIEERPTFIRPGYTLYGEHKQVIAKFVGDDNIATKAANPISQGGRVRGWLQYVLKGVQASQTHADEGAHWKIQFVDYLGNEYVATPAQLETHSPRFYPGAEQPFELPNQRKK